MIDGALLLDKPVGISSNAALQQAKRLLGAAKAGHAGTLDPLASGLLLVLLGEATKFAGHLLAADKEYLATLRLGQTTTTGDAEGELLQEKPVAVSETAIQSALVGFRGSIDQLPPMHSALKRGGVPLYKLARKGQTVERERRRIEISQLELLRRDGVLVDIRVRCSKGTYVRSLAADIGAALGCGAHLASLRRTGLGRFRVTEAGTRQALQAASARRDAELPLTALLDGLPRAQLDTVREARLRNGQALSVTGLPEGLCALYRADGRVIGLGRAEAGGALRAVRLTQAAEKHR